MNRGVALFLLSSVALSQTLPDRPSTSTDIVSGSPQGWAASTISLRYDVPDPIGEVQMNFTVENLGIVEGTLTFGESSAVTLPGQLLGCLPLPRPREANLSTLYISSADRGSQLPEEITSYVTIPYGRPVFISSGGASFLEYSSVEFGLTDMFIRRAAFVKPTGEKYVLSPVTDSCSRELTAWLAD